MTSFSNLLSRLRHSRKTWVISAVLTAAVVTGGAFVLHAALDPYDCRILDNVSIAGLDVGGMTRGEASQALKAAAEETLLSLKLPVELPEETILLSPADTRVRLHIQKAVNAAYQIGRKEEVTPYTVGLSPYLSCDEDYIKRQLAAYASQYDMALSESCYEMNGIMPSLDVTSFDADTPCQTLLLTLGTPTARLNTAEVLDQIMAVYDQAFAAAETGEFRVQAEVIPEALPKLPKLAAIFEEFTIAPVNDSLDMETYEFLPGSYGYSFDLEAATDAVTNADWGETISVPMFYVEPEILGDEVYFREVLGSCETRHTNDENRNTNLRLLCQALDGVILQPGETLSYNETVGERTAERGYKPANAYSGNRLVKDIGGGVCQGSTTLYNCALLADLEILERVCHGAKVGYVPLGLDAAVNWATKTDLKFRNNFHFPIMIRAEVSDGYVKMQILGTDEKDYYIEMHCGVGDEGNATYAVSYKYKYSKETGELLSKDLEARSAYYTLS